MSTQHAPSRVMRLARGQYPLRANILDAQPCKRISNAPGRTGLREHEALRAARCLVADMQAGDEVNIVAVVAAVDQLHAMHDEIRELRRQRAALKRRVTTMQRKNERRNAGGVEVVRFVVEVREAYEQAISLGEGVITVVDRHGNDLGNTSGNADDPWGTDDEVKL